MIRKFLCRIGRHKFFVVKWGQFEPYYVCEDCGRKLK